MPSIWSVEHIDVYCKGIDDYEIYAEAWIEDRIQISPATWEEPGEHRPGLCFASTHVEEKPPSDPSDLDEYIHELNRGNSLEWIDVNSTDI